MSAFPFQFQDRTYEYLRAVIDQFAGPGHDIDVAVIGSGDEMTVEVFADLPRDLRDKLRPAHPRHTPMSERVARRSVPWRLQYCVIWPRDTRRVGQGEPIGIPRAVPTFAVLVDILGELRQRRGQGAD